MPRTARIVVPGIPHHVTQRGNNKQIIFDDEADYRQYCKWMNHYAFIYGLEILAFCLMPNHIHLVASPMDEESLARTLHLVNTQYTRYINKRRQTCGHLFQGRYFSCPMDEAHTYRAIRYVERNPAEDQLAKYPWDYNWSSAKWHMGLTRHSHIFLRKTFLVRQDDWAAYLLEDDPDYNESLKRLVNISKIGFGTVPK